MSNTKNITTAPKPSSFSKKLEGSSKMSNCQKINFNKMRSIFSEMRDIKNGSYVEAGEDNDMYPTPEPTMPPSSDEINYTNRYNSYISKINTGLDTYNSIFENYNYLVDLDKVYINKTKELDGYAKKAYIMGLTDNRKTYYSNESVERLNYYYRIIYFIFTILMISFLIKIFWSMNPEFPFVYKILIFVSFIILPFIANAIYYLINVIIKYIQSFFPTAQNPVK
jgi:hypothetical protein